MSDTVLLNDEDMRIWTPDALRTSIMDALGIELTSFICINLRDIPGLEAIEGEWNHAHGGNPIRRILETYKRDGYAELEWRG